MIFGKTKLELKVGIFVFIGLVILIIFVLSIGGVKTWTSGYRFSIVFNFANGVKLGAPVRFAGIDVGQVQNIQLYYSNQEKKDKVQIDVWVKHKVKIPRDSGVWVNTLGLLGEKYIEIMPGEDFTQFVKENQTITGVDPIPMHEVFSMAKGIVDDLDKAITNRSGTIGKLFYDDELYNEIESAIKYKNGTIGRFIYDDSVYKEVEALISDIRKHPWKLFFRGK